SELHLLGLNSPIADVIATRVSQDKLQRILFLNPPRSLADDGNDLGLVVHVFRARRGNDGLTRPDQGAFGLDEQHGKLGSFPPGFLYVSDVIEAGAENSGAFHRRKKVSFLQWQRCAAEMERPIKGR